MGLGKLLLHTRVGFERIVMRYRHRVYGYACHMLGSEDDAADVAQEVFIRLWKKRSTVDEARILPWLLSVTRNLCIDALRHRQTVHQLISRNEHELESATSGAPAPDDVLETAELSRQLQEALESLSEPHRSIVILREIQGLSYADICAALDLPMTTVKVYLHRGRRMLRSGVAAAMTDSQ